MPSCGCIIIGMSNHCEPLSYILFIGVCGLKIYESQGLKTAIVEGDVVGGTCVNRGCVPSKALLAVSGRMRELQNEHHMKSFGLQVLRTFEHTNLCAMFLQFDIIYNSNSNNLL